MAVEQSFLPAEELTAAEKSNCEAEVPVGFTIGPPDEPPYQCHHCGKSYQRIDHIKRHYRSHENGREFTCHVCSKAFNRKDLLDRHRAIHDSHYDHNKRRPKRITRSAKACARCISAKTKCSDERPCRRCRDRGEICGEEAKARQSVPLGSNTQSTDGVGLLSAATHSHASTGPHQDGDPQSMVQNSSYDHEKPDAWDGFGTSTQVDLPFAAMQPTFTTHGTDGAGCASAWDPALLLNDSVFDVNDDIFMAMGLDWDSVFQPEQVQKDQNVVTTNTTHSRANDASASGTSFRVLLGHEAFKRSFWIWDPDPRESSLREEAPQLSEAEERLLLPPEGAERTYPADRMVGSPPPGLTCGSEARDALLLLVQQNSDPTVTIRSFPSSTVLTFILKTFAFQERSSRCPFVHLSSFVAERCRSELICALIVTGSANSANRQLWKLGLALQERTRRATYNALSQDNSVARTLDIIQAQILWVEIGLWSGSRRTMEVAESAANNVPTMLRRAGALNRGYYDHVSPPTPHDDRETLRSKWLKWIELECFKRCVFRALINDIQGSSAYTRSPCFYSTEITFELPAARALWDAPDPVTWRTAYLFRGEGRESSKRTLLHVIQDPSILQSLVHEYDCELSLYATLHCLWPQLAAFLDASTVQRASRSSRKSGQNTWWLEAQRQDLYKKLTDIRNTFEAMRILTGEAHVVCELFIMALFVSFVDIQKLAGRFGLRESRLTIPSLQAWSDSDEPRYAMWHAGQVLKAATCIKPNQLRGFYAIAVYQACLTLALPFLLDAVGLASTTGSPEPDGDVAPSSRHQTRDTLHDVRQDNLVILNRQETMQVKSYLLTGQGSPALLHRGEVKVLSNVELIPTMIADIFGNNHSSTVDLLPPLLEKLVALVRDLARLAGT